LAPDSVVRLGRRDLHAPIVRTLESRWPLVIDSIRPEDGIFGADVLLREGLRAYAGFPLVLAGRIVGGLSMYRRSPFPPALLDALDILARQAALALEHARLLGEAHTLQAMAAELASARDMQALLEGIVGRAMAAFGADGCGVWLLDEETGEIDIAASRGLSETFLRTLLPGPLRPTTATMPVFSELRRTRRPVVFRDAPTEMRAVSPRLADGLAREWIVSALRLPLFAPGGDVIGMLSLHHRRERPYGDEEVRLAQAFADQMAFALRNARLVERERQAREQAARLADEQRVAREAADRQLERLTTLTGITRQLLAPRSWGRCWTWSSSRPAGSATPAARWWPWSTTSDAPSAAPPAVAPCA
jgi:GAF domain-containing protein